MSKNRNLLEILLDLHKNGRSGVLRVERGSEKKQLVLNKGALVFAESNVPGDHLARIMIKMGLMPGPKVTEVTSLMKKGKTSEEAVLALSDSGMQSLEKGRREQAVVILASLLAWDHFDMHYYPGEDLVRSQVNLGLYLPELIALSARRAVSDHLIPTPPDFLQGSLCVSESSLGRAMDIPLDPVESYAYSLLHEPVNTADVLSLIHAVEEKPEELLLRLSVLGLIRLSKPAARPGGTSATDEPSSPVQMLQDMLLRLESANLYEILSVPPEASQDEIQAAYYELAKQLHPDRFQSGEFSSDARSKAEKVFTRINEAYVTLKDPASRALYDEKRLTKESKVEVELKARAAKQSEDERMAEAIYREGRILLAEGNFEEAVDRLKGSVWLCPEKASYHHYLGAAESEIPKFQKSAERNLLKAIELDSLSAASHLELAKLYRKVRLYRKAEMQLREFMRYDPENPEAHRLLSELKKLGKEPAGRNAKPA